MKRSNTKKTVNWKKLITWFFALILPLGLLILVIFHKPTQTKVLGWFKPNQSGTSQNVGNAPVSSGDTPKNAFERLKQIYDVGYLRSIEQLFRLETAHFKSGQWLKCLTPGMVAVPGTTSFPWGWTSLKQYATSHGLSPKDFGTVHFSTTSDGKPRTYIRFPNVYHSVAFVSWFLKNKRGGDVRKWYSLEESQYIKYGEKLEKITTNFV